MGTSDVKRYEDWGDLGMHEAPDGDWVQYEDHAADRAALVAQLEAAKKKRATCSLNSACSAPLRQGLHSIMKVDGIKLCTVCGASEPRPEEDAGPDGEADPDYPPHREHFAPTHAALVAQLEAARAEKADERRIAAEAWERIRLLESQIYELGVAAEAQVAQLTRERDEARAESCASCIRAQRRAESEVTRLTDELKVAKLHAGRQADARVAAESECAALRAKNERLGAHALECQDETKALRAEVERLRTERNEALESLRLYIKETHSIAARTVASLAAANALLWQAQSGMHDELGVAILAHLAAQPATAPAPSRAEEAATKRRERSLKGAATRRANAAGYSRENEDAMTYGVDDPATAPARTPGKFGYVHDLGDEATAPARDEAESGDDPSEEGDICRAELARREPKRG